jgi:molybdate transport system substrate-binding protein
MPPSVGDFIGYAGTGVLSRHGRRTRLREVVKCRPGHRYGSPSAGRARGKAGSWFRFLLVALLIGLSAIRPARADYPVAPDVVVFCEPTLQHAIADIGGLWRSQTGIRVRVFTSPTPALLQQIAHHARDDVLIGEGDANAVIASANQLIKPDTLRRLWRNRLVVAALDGPTGGGERSVGLASVAGKETIAIVDPWAAIAGSDSQKALQSLGLWQAVSAKSIGVVGTADAAFLLARGKVPLAVIYATDVAANPGFAIAERLPAASYPPIVYWVAQTQHALSPNAAKFIEFLRDPAAQQRLRTDGLEILP